MTIIKEVKMKNLVIYIESKKDEKFIDKLIKEYDLKPYNFDYKKDKFILQNFNNYIISDIRNDCFQKQIKYDDIY